MDKITSKLFKYFLFIITLVVIISFFESSIFLSKIYMKYQYNELKNTAEDIYDSIKKDSNINLANANAVIITKEGPISLGKGKMISILKNIDFSSLKEKDSFTNPMGQKFLSYKYTTDLGDIVVYRSGKNSIDYFKVISLVLIGVFVTALILSTPFIIYLGKKFTKPILKLQKASHEIANENFNVNIDLKTGDEIEDLSKSLTSMASKLQKKYILQREFIANVSHDFKTPLSIIRNYSEANYDGIIDFETSKEYSKEIMLEVDRLNKLVMDLLQLSKLQGDSINLTYDYFDLKEFLSTIVLKFSCLAKEKNISINFNYLIKSNNIKVFGDINYLNRVLYNFIDNALKFSFDGSTIDIYAKTITDGSLKISVKDNGKGISPDVIENIWNRYYKHSQSGGIGLGLAICSEILKKHNFKYGAHSILGEGAEFYFIIPSDKIE